jgi:ribonucleoside-diphosphate reductase alpha chain
MTGAPFQCALSEHIWQTKYRLADETGAGERDIGQSWDRVARALAAVEAADRSRWQAAFRRLLDGFAFLPGGRILAGAGSGRRVTLLNCFVMGYLEDSMESIFDGLKEGALTMQAGGGVGYDFSTLRPSGSQAHATGRIASGPLAFMQVWDAACGAILSTGARRGAMMATLRCDHPDIAAFVAAKSDPARLRHFNLSVQVSDAFMQAVEQDADWPLLFPAHALGTQPEASTQILERDWPGERGPVPCRVIRRVRARELWAAIMRANYDYAEPGVLFVDRINRLNNLWYTERISATNPCGEIPLPAYGACDLGSFNLVHFVRDPFGRGARLDLAALEAQVAVAVRLLDNVLDASRFPLPAQAAAARRARRIGIGLTGLADALIMLGLHYAADQARELAAAAMRTICHAAYRASAALAREKGSFASFERDAYLEGAFVGALPGDIRDAIAAGGIRNSHLTAIAPTGTISLLANNVSSGIEPVFDFRYGRRVLDAGGGYREFDVEDFAHAAWRREAGGDMPLPASFVHAGELDPHDHLAMQAALQPYVDSAISKTVNVPADYPFEDFSDLYRAAFQAGLKGCTTFRPNPVTGEILLRTQGPAPRPEPCCGLDREGD